MPTYQVAYRASTFTVVVQDEGEALPEGFTNIGTFDHHVTNDRLGHSHTIYHHVRDALYKADVTAMQMVSIYTNGMTIPEAPVDPVDPVDPTNPGGNPTDLPVPAAGILAAGNVDNQTYWNQKAIFIDLMKSSGGSWNITQDGNRLAYPQGSDGWLRGIAPGAQPHIWVALEQGERFGYIPRGNYVAYTTNDDVRLNIAGGGITNVVPGAGECTFTVRADVTPDQVYFEVFVRNDSAAPTDLTDLKICMVSERAALDGGAIFKPEFLGDLTNLSVVRTMDWAQVNNSRVTEVSQLRAPTDRVYATEQGGQVPFQIIGALAAEIDADLWVCVPAGTDGVIVRSYNGTTNTFHVEQDLTSLWEVNDQVYFYGDNTPLPAGMAFGTPYYVRNLTTTSFQLSTTSGGAPIDFATTAPDIWLSVTRAIDHVALYNEIASQVAEGLGADYDRPIYVEWSNEVWNTGFDHFQFARNVVGPRFASGQREQGLGYAAGSVLAWEAFEREFSRSQITRVACGQFAWFDILSPFFDFQVPATSVFDNDGLSMVDMIDVWAIAPYIGHSTLQDLATRGAASWTPGRWSTYMREEIEEVAFAVAQHVSELHAVAPGLPVTTYECGQHIALIGSTVTPALRAVQDSYYTYLGHMWSAVDYNTYLDDVFVEHNLLHFNHYTMAGGWTESGNFIMQWGLKPHHGEFDSPRFDWFRQLPKYL